MTHSKKADVVVLGSYVADLAFRGIRLPALGQTVAGSSFAVGPGGKGSNQAVAASRAGARVTLISKVGRDTFGSDALAFWEREGIVARVPQVGGSPTGAAFIYVNEISGDNAILVVPGACMGIDIEQVDASAELIASANVFVTQLEQPAAAAQRGLEIAREADTITVFNPAPAMPFDDVIYGLCDFITPNESEAEALSGLKIDNVSSARQAADRILAKGARHVLLTLGENGSLLHSVHQSVHISARKLGSVVETAGAGDAFNGGFAAALAEGASPLEAVHFATAVAALSVTRRGTAPSMPTRHEIDAAMID